MSNGDGTPNTRARVTWWPAVSALIIAGVGYYALVLPPFIALLLVGAAAIVGYRLLDMLRVVFDNVVIAALSGIALMLSMLSGMVAVPWFLWTVLSKDPSPVERWQAATSTPETIASTLLLLACLLLGLLALFQGVMLWLFVRSDRFGPKQAE